MAALLARNDRTVFDPSKALRRPHEQSRVHGLWGPYDHAGSACRPAIRCNGVPPLTSAPRSQSVDVPPARLSPSESRSAVLRRVRETRNEWAEWPNLALARSATAAANASQQRILRIRSIDMATSCRTLPRQRKGTVVNITPQPVRIRCYQPNFQCCNFFESIWVLRASCGYGRVSEALSLSIYT